MDLSEMTPVSPPALSEAPTAQLAAGSPPPTTTYAQCDECGSPVDADQRYCVSCGAHRRNVNDPAARYLSHATARSRTSRAAAPRTRSRRAGGGLRGLGVALLLALVPAVAAVGVLVGRSSNNQDAKLIQALERNQAARAASSTTPTSTVTSAAAASATTTHTGTHKAKSHKRSSAKAAAAKSRQSGNSTTKYGTVSQIAGSKPTKAQEQQGAKDTQNVQKSTGKSYVNGQSGLPSTVVIP
ncbi:MAG TPA: zinc ribbon domain-containing protein [Solirubrobacteraceae bacterium]|nr:zinc ribbon domain-containing protein [Solirubrobacteraceae bacterium]